jgi:hypothetical protein
MSKRKWSAALVSRVPSTSRFAMRMLACLLLGALSSALEAQTVIPDRQTCVDCKIEFRTAARLGSPDGPGAIPGRFSSMSIDAQGRYWVAFQDASILVYGRDGRFVRSVGRRGQGPGEFASAVFLMPAADSMVAFDNGNMRVTVIGPDFVPVRSAPMPGPITAAAAARWPGRVVVNATWGRAESVGWPLHLLDLGGPAATVLASFGPGTRELQTGQARRHAQVLAGSPDGTVWSGDRTQYRVTEWTNAGELQRSLTRQPAWFGASEGMMGGPARPPEPAMTGIRLDSVGRLWVITRIPAHNWRAAWQGIDVPRGRGEISAARLPDPTTLYDSMIEVIDTKSNRVIARQRAGSAYIPIGAGVFASYRESELGVPVIVVSIATIS